MNQQLLPCPFCGGVDIEISSAFTCDPEANPLHGYCTSCTATSPISYTGTERAIQLWNTRHEPKPASKSKGTYEEVAEFCKSIGLPESDAEYFFNKCEGCGWLNGNKKIKDWRATIRSWKAAGYMPSTKHPTVPPTRGRSEPVWVQIKRIEEQIDTHPANPSFRGHRADKVTPEQKEHYENQKANLKRLKGELL